MRTWSITPVSLLANIIVGHHDGVGVAKKGQV